jgi:hypothetical protein
MGGFGSGRIQWSSRAVVEDCISLSITQLLRRGIIGSGSGGGTLSWRNVETGEENGSVGFWVDAEDVELVILHLKYTVTIDDVKTDIKEAVRLSYTRPHFGGKRWWFLCPLKKNGKACCSRVGRLHLPPGGHYFGCRKCYDLTYQACQESHKFEINYKSS